MCLERSDHQEMRCGELFPQDGPGCAQFRDTLVFDYTTYVANDERIPVDAVLIAGGTTGSFSDY
jgi:hypothetical protein